MVIDILYIERLSKMDFLKNWQDYIAGIVALTIIYGIIYLAAIGIYKIIKWAFRNIE